MKLTYRGIQYNESKDFCALTLETSNKEIIYRGNSSKGRINPKFPWLDYTKQLFFSPKSESIFNPIAFWYARKKEFLEECWYFGDIDRLNIAWNTTIQIEKNKALRSKPKTKLKYRGVTYYK